MPTRRNFLAGLTFCSCGLLQAAHAQAPSPSKRPVMVAGQPVRTVDMHAHCYFQDAIDLMGDDAKTVLPPVKGVPQHFLAKPDVVAERLAAMDAMGIDMEVLSINPYWYGKDRDTAGKIVALINQHFAELHAAYPLASRPTPPFRCSSPTSPSSSSRTPCASRASWELPSAAA